MKERPLSETGMVRALDPAIGLSIWQRFQFKLLGYLLALSCLSSVVAGGIYYSRQVKFVEAEQATRGRTLISNLAGQSELGAYSNDSAFLTAHDEDAGWSEPLMWMGILDAVQNRPTDARGHLEEALKADNQNGFIPEAIGVICLALGHTKEADKQFEAAKKLGRDVPDLK